MVGEEDEEGYRSLRLHVSARFHIRMRMPKMLVSTSPPPPPAPWVSSASLSVHFWSTIRSTSLHLLEISTEEGFAKSNEEEEMEMDGVVKSDCKSKEEEEDDESLEEIVKDKKEMSDEKRPSSRDSRESAEAEAAGMKCKKTDGKGWHCKRAAQIPHSLCSYHLTQVRSYRTRFEDQIHGNGSRGNSKRREKPASAGETGGVASNYYYYSVIGPWWGKRRGPINGRESSESDISAQEHDDNTDNVGVGDDEEEDDEGSRCDHVIYKNKRPLNKKKKKRGRKPVKARSLKSLL
ncbi:hypothetical protein KSP39_PZI013290 [Platanthera zijinensis]|uniref:WRC domain-containing protein n=1 Tax=Platanthera zijinensis TaxID=2320716 RepID=A0AAP0BCQ2_9ASPA